MSSRWREAEKRAERDAAWLAQEVEDARKEAEHADRGHTFNDQNYCGCGTRLADVVAEQGEAIVALQERVQAAERREQVLVEVINEMAQVLRAVKDFAAEIIH